MSSLIYVLSVNGLLFFISILFFYFPPKKINNFYGYRTHRSMSHQEIWDFANATFNRALVKFSGIGFAIALAVVFLLPALMKTWVPMALLFISLFACIASTEKALNASYDSEGQPKKKK